METIEPMELLSVLNKVEELGAIETADRGLMLVRQIWRYWLPTAGNEQRDITEGLKSRLLPYRGKNFPAIVELQLFGELLRAMHAYKGGPIVRTALLLAPMLYQRPGNLRMMEWVELDLDAGTLVFTRFNRHLLGSKLKRRTRHEESKVSSRIQG